jgi:hypothetical protein
VIFGKRAAALAPSELYGILNSVRIDRGSFSGPAFGAPSAGPVGEPTTESIQGKLTKSYITDHPRQLLAYIDINPMYPETVWRGNLLEFLDKQLRPLPFEAIWLFDYRKATVLLRYPEP